MTDLGLADERVIAAEAPQYNATIVRREDMHESLACFWVRFTGDPTPFAPGQYMTIGVFANDRLVQRPYSVASDPAVAGSEGYEFYVRLVEGGQFTPLLWRLPIGHGMRMIGPKGKFTLEPDDGRTHLFISSGTGNAPFVSMMKATLREGRPRRSIFINGVSYVVDLGYRGLLEQWQSSGDYPVEYIPTVSRPNDPLNSGWTGWTGRAEGVLERACDEFKLSADNAIAYLCGNPDMILSAEQVLLSRGFPEPLIKKELYWPKGKEPRGPQVAAGAAGTAAAADDDEAEAEAE